jgi:hypothetical protein
MAASYIWALAASEGLEGFRAGSPPPPDWSGILDRAATTDRRALDLDASWAYPYIVMGVLCMYRYRALIARMETGATTAGQWLAQSDQWLQRASRFATSDLGGYVGVHGNAAQCRSAVDTLSRVIAEREPGLPLLPERLRARAYAASILINACEVRTAAMLNAEGLPDSSNCLTNSEVLDYLDRAGAPCNVANALDTVIVDLDSRYQATRKARAHITIAEHLAAEALVRDRWKNAALSAHHVRELDSSWEPRDSVMARIRRQVEPVFADTLVDQRERVRLARYLAKYSVALARFGAPADSAIRASLRGVIR